jgi:uncharacterized cofD-like protein
LDADLIVAGPGSLFTSVLPNLLVPGIRRAVAVASAFKLYVCNVATQPGETDGFDLGQHVDALQRHVGSDLFPCVLANSNMDIGQDTPGAQMVALRYPGDGEYRVVEADLVDPASPWRHHANRLAERIMAIVATATVAT